MVQRNITATIGSATQSDGFVAVSVANKPDPVAFLATAATDAATVKNQISASLAASNITAVLATLHITDIIAVQTDITAAQAGTSQDIQVSINTGNVTSINKLRSGLRAILKTAEGIGEFTS